MVGRRNSGEGNGYIFFLWSNGSLAVQLNNGSGTNYISTSADLRDNVWHYVVAVGDRNNNLSFYVDGAFKGQNDISIKGDIDSISNVYVGWEEQNPNMKVLSRKCTMGEGRQISFGHSNGEFILVMDTDTVYFPTSGEFLKMYLEKYTDVAIQSMFLGVFPRTIWEQIGGRRSLNAFEDVDMWIRIWELGKMRWYPVMMGDNVKEVEGTYDFLSTRYSKRQRVTRLLRKEYDLLKTTRIRELDLEKIAEENTIDLGLGEMRRDWFGNYPKLSRTDNIKRFGREMKRTLKG